MAYNLETILAEKLETVISRGQALSTLLWIAKKCKGFGINTEKISIMPPILHLKLYAVQLLK